MPQSDYVALETIVTVPATSVVDELVVGSDVTVRVHFVLLQRGAGTVSVRVGLPDGTPLAGVATTLYDSRATVGSVRTDASGNAVYASVPFGVYGVAVTPPPGYKDLGDPPFVFRDNIVVDRGTTQQTSFSLAPCRGSAQVSVLDEGGAPVTGVPISLYTYAGAVANFPTANDGVARFTGITCDEYGIALGVFGGYTVNSGRGSSFIDGVRVTRNASLALSFRVASCRGTISILVTDASSGAAVAGVPVVLYSVAGVVGNASTGSDGLARFKVVECAEYGVSLGAAAGYTLAPGRGTSFVDGLRLNRDTTVALSFRVTSCRGTISVLVVSAGGTPVPGAVVQLYSSTSILETATAGADGRLSFGRAPCGMDLGVNIAPPKGYSVVAGRGSSYFDGITVQNGSNRALTFTLTGP